MRILVLGASGMLGHRVLGHLYASGLHDVTGAARNADIARYFPPAVAGRIVPCPDLSDPEALDTLIASTQPEVIVNCVGLVKQLAVANDPLQAVPLNTLLPHRLERLCRKTGSRLIHISTDCVFSGERGGYTEEDRPDATDLYGLSKLLGEVDQPHAVTLRTSIIGRELGTRNGLVEWFLAQEGEVKGFTRAIFSGLTTRELAHVVSDVVIPRPELRGLYHVASRPISKFDLLGLLAAHYNKDIRIVPDEGVVIDRSLRADRFTHATGYQAPAWPQLVQQMDMPMEGAR